MSIPPFSISVPVAKQAEVKERLPDFLAEVGMKGSPAKLSTLVWLTILTSVVLDSNQLVAYATKENMKTTRKKYIVLAL